MMSGHGASVSDARWMRAALALAARGLGRVWPNPSVGCVIVRDGAIVGQGWTQPGGRPHAEVEALADAGSAAQGATVYVSLEPCAHHGRTPPCVDALVAAGVARVVVACEDPDPRVDGAGIARLRAAGMVVDVGAMRDEARCLNEGFFRRLRDGRPLVTLKLATTLDGRIATPTGESRWITGPVARAWGHGLRARNDVIMVGINTAMLDDPDLTCRLPGMADRSPIRVVVDSRMRLPLTARLVATAQTRPTWLMTLAGGDPARAAALRDAGVEMLAVAPDDRRLLDVSAGLRLLADRGITRVLVEGGSKLAASLFKAGTVDRIEWFRNPRVIGGDGTPAVAGWGTDRLDDLAAFRRTALRRAGDDLWESFERMV
jgi:diaminohydroxyphosphoribosylaminopyrimidine deaminase / 5-amino-6-(5-phosphoribosylamino)uracil reductase